LISEITIALKESGIGIVDAFAFAFAFAFSLNNLFPKVVYHLHCKPGDLLRCTLQMKILKTNEVDRKEKFELIGSYFCL
jgi:hypothetical protein